MTSIADPGAQSHFARDTPQRAAARLGLPTLLFYGVGGLAENLPLFGLSHLVLFYLTIICGMSGSAAGLALGLALVVDGFFEPLIGSLSDNSHSRHGRRHPFMLAGLIGLAVGFVLLFSIPAAVKGTALFCAVIAMLLVARISFAAYNVPYVALGAELTDDYHERSLVVAARLLFGQAAAALA